MGLVGFAQSAPLVPGHIRCGRILGRKFNIDWPVLPKRGLLSRIFHGGGAGVKPFSVQIDTGGDEMSGYAIEEFIQSKRRRGDDSGVFALVGERLLAVDLKGMLWAKAGSMIAYQGNIKFSREGFFEHGVGHFLKGAITGEGPRLMKAEGRGELYLADAGKKIFILDLAGQSLRVNAQDVLAFEDGLDWDIALMRKIAGMLAGGLFNMRFGGHGSLAIATHYEPLVLSVRPGAPVVTDPNATVAWSASLEPALRTDVSLKTLIGRGSGESLQMRFEGEGWVLVQPCETFYAGV